MALSGECIATPGIRECTMHRQALSGAGIADRMGLITGSSVFLHTPCGGHAVPSFPGRSRQHTGLSAFDGLPCIPRRVQRVRPLFCSETEPVGGGPFLQAAWQTEPLLPVNAQAAGSVK